jgi:hypothetical protein
MARMTRRSRNYIWCAGVGLATLGMALTLPSNLAAQAAGRGQGRGQQGGPSQSVPTGNTVPSGFYDPGLNRKLLPPGGPAPRTADGHPNLTGRYYPNGAGRMVGSYTPGGVEPDAARLFDPKVTPQENPVFRPEAIAKYKAPTPYGTCAPGGTPTSITTQATEHGPMQIIQLPGEVWILSEFPQTIRWIPTDGRPHSEDPDVSFNGESVGHWEGDTLVVDTIAIDERMRNISVGATGDANAWSHSDKEHVIERFSRPSKNFLTYQITVEDPVVLAKPFTSAPQRWSLAQAANDTWTEYLCTANEDNDAWKQMDPKIREQYEKGGTGTDGDGNPLGRGPGAR